MIENLQQIIKEQLAEQANSAQYNAYQVPNHSHNGIDSPRISQTDIIPNEGYTAVFKFYPGAPYTNLFPVPSNATSLTIHGFAANNVNTAATKRAIVSGTAYFAPSYFYQAGVTQLPTTSVPFSQICNAMYIDSNNLANTRVISDAEHIAIVADESSTLGNPLLSIKVDSYQQGYISITQDVWNDEWEASLAIIIK